MSQGHHADCTHISLICSIQELCHRVVASGHAQRSFFQISKGESRNSKKRILCCMQVQYFSDVSIFNPSLLFRGFLTFEEQLSDVSLARAHTDTNNSKVFINPPLLISQVFPQILKKSREIRNLFTFYNVTSINFTKKNPTFPYLE